MKVTYREYCMELRALQSKFDRRILITDLGGTLDAPAINMGVNWASIGRFRLKKPWPLPPS